MKQDNSDYCNGAETVNVGAVIMCQGETRNSSFEVAEHVSRRSAGQLDGRAFSTS